MTSREPRGPARFDVVAGAGVCLLAALLRSELLGVRSLWFDEGYSLFVARMRWAEILRFLRLNDAHPPGYYLLLSAWARAFGDGLAVLRLPSFAAGVLSVWLTWVLGRRWAEQEAGLLAGLLAAVNPFQVYASNELRMYMPVQMILLGAAWVLDRAVKEDGLRWWLAYGLLVAASAYFSYFAAFALAPQAAWVAWVAGRRGVRGLGVAGAVALALYAPWLPYLQGFAQRNPQLWLIRPPLSSDTWPGEVASFLASQTFGGYLPNTVTYHRTSLLAEAYLPFLAPFVLAAAVGAARLVRDRRGVAPAAWLGGLGLAIGLSLVSGVLVAYPRNLVFLQPFAAVTVAAGAVELCRRLPHHLRRVGLVVAAGLLLLPAWAGLQNLQSGRPEFDAFRYDRAARFLDERFRAEDLVVYFPTGVEHAFGYYFRRQAKSVSLAARVEQWDPQQLRPLFAALEPHLRETRGRVWTVTSLPATRRSRPSQLLEALWQTVEAAGYRRVGLRDFLGVQVALFERSPR
jgi:hypothetical protein